MARASIGGISAIVLGLLLALCGATTAAGQVYNSTEWAVGGDKGWSFGVHGWEKSKPIQPGDVLVFKYNPKAHNVVEVDADGYMECKAPAGAKTYSSGNDKIPISGEAYFICGLPGHCEKGMRIGIPPR